jgi:GH25 family lysozyme M1 (1,4-beta-N-acetylmuramidase)
MRRPLVRSTLRLAAVLGTAALVAAGTIPAADAAGSRSAPVSHPQDDHAGSTVVAHEGRGSGTPNPSAVTQTRGMDVSSWQGNVNWSSAYANGARFAYVKATEGTSYTNPYFAQQYNGSYNVGMIRGAYHFALPDRSSGTTQADYFVNHGGGWSADGKTLPPALDIEYNPYGATCYGLSQSSMVSWIRAFSNEVHSRTSRYPVIYTTTDWWTTCTGNNSSFASTNPLWIARYASTVGTLPAGWTYYTFWQYASSGTFPGDQDYFNGAYDRLQALANG